MAAGAGAWAATLSGLFGAGMVIQRDAPIPVWGWGSKGETVTVTLAGRTRTTRVGDDGSWRVELPRMRAGGLTSRAARRTPSPAIS